MKVMYPSCLTKELSKFWQMHCSFLLFVMSSNIIKINHLNARVEPHRFAWPSHIKSNL